MSNPTSPPAPSSAAPSTCPRCGAAASGRFCNDCGAPLVGAVCAGCASALTPGAKFCHRCGTAVGATPTARAQSTGMASALPWAVAGIALVALIALLAGQHFGARTSTVDAPQTALPQAGLDDRGAAATDPNAPRGPDISALDPRERADRLYDRIMRLDSEGKRDSVQFFAPMGVQAFQMLPDLDADARYDMGRIAQVAGAPQLARIEADSILHDQPNHLLGLILAAAAARASGHPDQAAAFETRLRNAAPAELRAKRPEYERHQTEITAALGGKLPR
jgi:hypothetical protein